MKPYDFKQIPTDSNGPLRNRDLQNEIVLKKRDLKSPAIWFLFSLSLCDLLLCYFYDYYCLVSVFDFIYMALVGMLLFAHGSFGNFLD